MSQGVRFAFAVGALLVTSAACELPRNGEVLVIVDTDVPVSLADRMRIDLFRPDGVWYASPEASPRICV